MARPWQTLAAVETERGTLELRQRGERDFLITVSGRVLMTSTARRSEIVLAEMACAPLSSHPGPRVLIGGLGMGFTLRAALDCLPTSARVTVAELHETVVEWCRAPLATLTDGAIGDARVRVEIADVADVIRRAARAPAAPCRASDPDRFDAIVLDLYEGPRGPEAAHPHYGDRALADAHAALRPDGTFAVWSEDPDGAFEGRLRRCGFEVERHRPGRGGRRHAVYVATRASHGTRRR